MPMFCMNCNQDTKTIPCEHCGKLFNIAAQFMFEITDEQYDKLNLPDFDVSQFIGIPCATCGEPFTQAFFDAEGTIVRTADDRWQHDHCRSEN